MEAIWDTSHPFLVGIGGGTASGKSTLVERIIADCGNGQAVSLSLDLYYKDQSSLGLQDRECVNYDHPNAIDFEAVASALHRLKKGLPVEVPQYDFITHSRTGNFTVHPKPVIVVEGLFALSNANVRSQFDLSVFVHADSDVRLCRRLQRDIVERGGSVDGVIGLYIRCLKPMHTKHIEPTRSFADVVVINQSEIAVAVNQLNHAILAARASEHKIRPK